MEHRFGKKNRGGHTTVIPLAGEIYDLVHKLELVIGISFGLIKAGLKSVNGQRRVKLTDVSGGIALGVRDNTSFQEIKVYADNLQEARTAIARVILNKGVSISFQKTR